MVARAPDLDGRTVSAGYAKGLVELAVELGARAERLVEEAGVDPAALDDQDARLSWEAFVRLTHAAKRLTGEPALPLVFGARVPMRAFSVVGLLFHTCATIAEAIREVNRFGQLITETGAVGDRFTFEGRRGETWLVDRRPDPNLFPELTESTFARFISMTSPLWDTPLVQEIEVTHEAPAHAEAYERILGVPATFGTDWNAMRIDPARLTQPIATQPRYAFGLFSARAEELLAELAGSRTVRGRLEALLVPMLHKGPAAMTRVAADLGMSRPTLFRKLRAEGTSFEEVLDTLRHRMAVDYLSGRKASVHETAYLVGFSDRAAFSRAFKRWTGMNPGQFRAGQE